MGKDTITKSGDKKYDDESKANVDIKTNERKYKRNGERNLLSYYFCN